MILYTDPTLDKAIEQAGNSIKKLASVKPTDEFTLNDINHAIYFITRFQEECISEKHRRERAKLKERRTHEQTAEIPQHEDL